MTSINKFGECLVKSKPNEKFKNNILSDKFDNLKFNITLKMNRIENQFDDLNKNFTNKHEESINKFKVYIFKSMEVKMEELKRTFDSQLNIIKSDIRILKESLKKDINQDVEVMENAIKNQINITNKDFKNNIEERFNKIEDFIFKWVDQNAKVNNDIKKRKLELPKIKTA